MVVVSKPAARLGLELLDRYWPLPPARQQWFAVGAATGALLADYGLDACWPSAGDDSEALLALPQLQQAIDAYEATPAQDPLAVFEHLYARWPQALAEQREQFAERVVRRTQGADHE